MFLTRLIPKTLSFIKPRVFFMRQPVEKVVMRWVFPRISFCDVLLQFPDLFNRITYVINLLLINFDRRDCHNRERACSDIPVVMVTSECTSFWKNHFQTRKFRSKFQSVSTQHIRTRASLVTWGFNIFCLRVEKRKICSASDQVCWGVSKSS